MVRLTLVVLTFIALAGCRRENPDYCPANPGMQDCPDAPLMGGSCHIDDDCKIPNLRVCDTRNNDGTCVRCTESKHDACQNPTPACMNDTCQKCTQHSQCASRACLPDGTCADSTQIAYIRPGGSGTACSDTSPCGTLADGIKAKSTVKIEANSTSGNKTVSDDKVTTIDGKKVLILADAGTQLTRSMPGTILDVRNDGADVSIYDLEITGGTGMKTDAAVSLSGGNTPKLTLTRVTIDGNGGFGIVATNGTLIVSRSKISNNAGGGVAVVGTQFDLTNNFITGNGTPTNGGAASTTTFGGVFIDPLGSGTRTFEFNTVTNNSAAVITGVICTSVAQSVTLSNNIVYGNQAGTGRSQTGGTSCNWTYSDIGDLITATGNMNIDPLYVAPAQENYHLMPGSPAKDKADAAATITIDFDGELRPQNGRSDMGADEIEPAQ